MKQKHTKYTQINKSESTHSEMGPVRGHLPLDGKPLYPLLAIPSTRRSFIGDRAFVVVAASVKLSQDLRSATSILVFGRRLKTPLFDNAFLLTT